MGNPKQKWTAEEEEALRAGIAKHGTGKWKLIQRDPEFNPFLFARSNIDLKDKWRNMIVSAGGPGPRDKSRSVKPKADSDVPAVATSVSPIPVSNLQTPASVAPLKAEPIDDSSKGTVDGKTAPNYNALVFEAIRALNEQNGLETSTIVSYIEQRAEVPQNFRRQLTSRLRRLVAQNKLEKVHNCYRIKNNAPSAIKVPTPSQNEFRPKPSQSPDCSNSDDSVNEASIAAAYRIAEAENKSFVAAEAVKEAERVAKMAEDTDLLLQLATEIFDKCSRGQVVIMA